MGHGETQLSKRIKEGIEKCRFKLYKFLYTNWKPTRTFCMKRETADSLAFSIHYNILKYKDNNTFEFNHNTLEIIKYIFTVVVLRDHFKLPVKTVKINNVKVIQSQPSPILDIIIHNLGYYEFVKKYTETNSYFDNQQIILQITNILFTYFNADYDIKELMNRVGLNTPSAPPEEEKFLGHKRFNQKYDGYYIVQVKRNDDFDVLSVDKYNCTLQYEVITSYTKIRASVIMDNNLYVVFSPFQKKAYMYHVNKRGFRLIRCIYNPNYIGKIDDFNHE